jgi:NTPase
VVIDELGKMELASAAFRGAVQRLLDTGCSLVATVHTHRHPFTSGPAHDGQPGRGNPTSRPAATYASTASGHGHTMATGDTAPDPFSRSAQHEARRDPSRSTGTPRS